MAKRRARRSGRQNGNGARITSGGETARTLDATAESSMVPQVLLGAVNGIETVAVGALQLGPFLLRGGLHEDHLAVLAVQVSVVERGAVL